MPDELTRRKAHVKRIYRRIQERNSSGALTKDEIDEDYWTDMLRIDVLPVMLRGMPIGSTNEVIGYKFNWRDGVTEDEQGTRLKPTENNNPSRTTKILDIYDPESPSDDPIELYIVEKAKVSIKGFSDGKTSQVVGHVFNNVQPEIGDPDNPERPLSNRQVIVVKVKNNDLDGFDMKDSEFDESKIVPWEDYKQKLQDGEEDDSQFITVDMTETFNVMYRGLGDGKTDIDVKFVLTGNKLLAYGADGEEPMFELGDPNAVDADDEPCVVRCDPLQVPVNVGFGSGDFLATFNEGFLRSSGDSFSHILGRTYGSKNGIDWVELTAVPVPPNTIDDIPRIVHLADTGGILLGDVSGVLAEPPHQDSGLSLQFGSLNELAYAQDNSQLGDGVSQFAGHGPLYDFNLKAQTGGYGPYPGGGGHFYCTATVGWHDTYISAAGPIGAGLNGTWFSTGGAGSSGGFQTIINRAPLNSEPPSPNSWSKVHDTGTTLTNTHPGGDYSPRYACIATIAGNGLQNGKGLSVGCRAKNNIPLCSRDGGSTWLALTLPGYATGLGENSDFINGADKVKGTLWIYGSGLWRTTDGVTWSASNNPFVDEDGYPLPITGIAYHSSIEKYVIVSTDTDFLSATSPDGAVFKQSGSRSNSNSTSLCRTLASNGETLVAAAGAGATGPGILTSSDAATWTLGNPGGTAKQVVFSKKLFVVGGVSGLVGKIWSSPDGIDWTERVTLTSPGGASTSLGGIGIGKVILPETP